MRGLLLHGSGAAERANWIDEFIGTERGATVLALITKGAVASTPGTGSFDISICEEGLRFFVIKLFGFLRFKFATIMQVGEEFTCRFVMKRVAGAMINVEADAEVVEVLLHRLVVFVDDLAGRLSFLP